MAKPVSAASLASSVVRSPSPSKRTTRRQSPQTSGWLWPIGGAVKPMSPRRS